MRLGSAQETYARNGEPAKTTSAGVVSVSMVAVTRSVGISTTLIASEIWLTTQASLLLRNRTETGSMPTAAMPTATRLLDVMSKSSSVPSAKLQTATLRASGLMAIGRTGAVSKLTKLLLKAAEDCAKPGEAAARRKQTMAIRRFTAGRIVIFAALCTLDR